jgi:hypothetical protein
MRDLRPMSAEGRSNISTGLEGVYQRRPFNVSDTTKRAADVVGTKTPEAQAARSERSRIAAKGIRTCSHEGCGFTGEVGYFLVRKGIPKFDIPDTYECRDELACSARIVESWGQNFIIVSNGRVKGVAA